MNREPSPADYENLPYEGHPDPLIHPERMACIAALFGVDSPKMAGARVLEIGCATGAHLIPMACQLPEAAFYGFDYAPGHITEARQTADALGLKNIQFEVRDLAAASDGLGAFDYIFAHGVFSWLSPALQDRLLSLCREHLAPRGIALIDYNVFPGWHLRSVLRDLFQFTGDRQQDPAKATEESLDLLSFIGESSFAPKSPYTQAIQSLSHWSKLQSKNYLAHEFGAAVNQPVLFTEFAARAKGHRLAILGDAQITHAIPRHLEAGINARLQQLGGNDYIRREQIMDFLRGRDFRRTLLVRQETSMQRETDFDAMANFYLTTLAREERAMDGILFTCPDGTGFKTTDARYITLLKTLCQAGAAGCKVASLYEIVQSNLRPAAAPEETHKALAELLVELSAIGLVQLHFQSPRAVGRISMKPLANALARLQAQKGDAMVTSMLQRDWTVSAFDRQLLGLLDGNQDLAAIVSQIPGPREDVRNKVNAALTWYARAGLLVG